MELHDLLFYAGLLEYEDALAHFGVDCVDDLDSLLDEDWEGLRVKPLHKLRIMLEKERLPSIIELECIVVAAEEQKQARERELERERRKKEEERDRLVREERERLIREEKKRHEDLIAEKARRAEEVREQAIREERARAKREQQLQREQEEAKPRQEENDDNNDADDETSRLERLERKRIEAQRMAEVAAARERKRLEKEDKLRKKALERGKAVAFAATQATSPPSNDAENMVRVRKRVSPPNHQDNAPSGIPECKEWMMSGFCSKLAELGYDPRENSAVKLKKLQASGKKSCESQHRPKYRGCLMDDEQYFAMIENEK